jgi:protein involved in polysaccharide export with SLBB domain
MVIGQVNRPGEVQIPPEGKLTVIEAIGFANGYTRYARKSDIEVSKKGQKSVRCSDDEQRNSPDKVLYLEHGDVVFVHESRI